MTRIPQREEQALREVGQTSITARTGWILVLFFLLTLVSVALLEPMAEDSHRDAAADTESTAVPSLGPWQEFARGISASFRTAKNQGLLEANHELLAVMDSFELRLEEESFLRRLVLPPLQGFLTTHLGVGNEQAYLGLQDWLFYRPDMDYVTGRGFLDESVLRARVLQSDPWVDPPQPDPIPALIELQSELQARDVHLVLLPTPVKPMLEPEHFSRRYSRDSPALQNPSYEDFRRRLEEAGIEVIDVTSDIWEVGQAGSETQFLHTDTHWTPEAVEQAARSLGQSLIARGWSPSPRAGVYLQRQLEVENLGDIAPMLTPTPAQVERWRQRVTIRRVVDGAGRPWRSDPKAEVLLLGDSFSNIYSDPGLGWGIGAGLAEQLSFFLQRPVDKIALNAGGALAARKALRRHWTGGTRRLEGKRVVIYQFAVRELRQGDWRLLGVD